MTMMVVKKRLSITSTHVVSALSNFKSRLFTNVAQKTIQFERYLLKENIIARVKQMYGVGNTLMHNNQRSNSHMYCTSVAQSRKLCQQTGFFFIHASRDPTLCTCRMLPSMCIIAEICCKNNCVFDFIPPVWW